MKVINILLVEDDLLDVMNIKRTLDKLKVFYTLNVARNGEEAVALLEQRELSTSNNLPDIVIIDINMPKINGLELLSIMRNSPKWKNLNCFIMTTSDEQVDKEEARALGVSGFIVKPLKSNNYSSEAYNLLISIMNMKE